MFNENPTISIILPCRNEARTLSALLQSLQNQTYPVAEIILADAQSTDSSLAIAKSHSVKVVRGGLPSIGRNAGALVASGELLWFVDADLPPLPPDFLHLAVQTIIKNRLDYAVPQVSCSSGSIILKLGHHLYNLYVSAWGKFRPHTIGGCLFISSKLFATIGGFDPLSQFCEDQYLGLVAKNHGQFGIIKNLKIDLNPRRYQNDGPISTATRFILAELHLIFIGPIRHNLLGYRLDYDKT